MIVTTDQKVVDVLAWQIEMMVGVGLEPEDAIRLAEEGCDWHDVVRLIDCGCPMGLIPKIVVPRLS